VLPGAPEQPNPRHWEGGAADELLACVDGVQVAALVMRSCAKASQVTRADPPDPANPCNQVCGFCAAP